MALTIDNLVGQRLGFYGAQNKDFVFKLGRHVLQAVCNDDDEYRSVCEEVKEISPIGYTFSKKPLCFVSVTETEHTRIDGWKLTDDKGHVWLVVGTDTNDDCYPAFEFQYNPPKEA